MAFSRHIRGIRVFNNDVTYFGKKGSGSIKITCGKESKTEGYDLLLVGLGS